MPTTSNKRQQSTQSKSAPAKKASSSKATASQSKNPNRASGKADNSTSKADSTKDNTKLEEFFHEEIKDIYWAEQKLVKTLPKMAKAATSEELRNAFTEHLEQTKEHVARLEEV